jgi:hypothetical protein
LQLFSAAEEAMDWLMLSTEWDGNQAWVQSAAEGLGWGILLWAAVAGTILILAPLAGATIFRRRRFWCSPAGGAVEVEFEEYRLAGRHGAVAVRSCSAFDPPCDVRCSRSCLKPELRVALPNSLPLVGGKP